MTEPQLSPPESVPRQTLGRRIAAASIVLAGFSVIALFYAFALQSKNPTESDFIGYWAGGQQLAHHANSYDIPACLALERAAGYAGAEPRITPSPPIALFLLWPIGLLSAKAGLFVWTMTMLAILALSLRLLGMLFAPPSSLAPLAGFLFVPALTCLQAGQLGILFLVSIVLFLSWIEKRPFLAGAALLPLFLKPHLFAAFALTLLLWIVFRRAWLVLAGTTTAAAIGSALTLALDPRVWSHYFAFLHTASLANRYTPTLSVGLPLLLHSPANWLRFVPTILACIWAVYYFRSRRTTWRWDTEGLLLLAVAVAASPYAWITDEAVLLTAVFVAVFRAPRLGRPAWPILVVAAIALAELGLTADIKSWAYVWTPLAWLACALYTLPKKESREPEPAAS
jgi:hypothetical protein